MHILRRCARCNIRKVYGNEKTSKILFDIISRVGYASRRARPDEHIARKRRADRDRKSDYDGHGKHRRLQRDSIDFDNFDDFGNHIGFGKHRARGNNARRYRAADNRFLKNTSHPKRPFAVSGVFALKNIMEFNIKICNIVINIKHSYGYIRALCREYIEEDGTPPDFSVAASKEAVETEKKAAAEMHHDGIYEATCLHREIVKGLVSYGIILMHSAAIAVDGKAYIFMAKSGVGKSTHIGLWREVFGDRAVVVNGDKPFFSFEGDTLTVHGSPWKGKEGLGEPVSMPVCGICFLERGNVNTIAPASDSEAVSRLFHQVLLPKSKAELDTFMALLNRIFKTVPFYILRCNMDKEAALVAYEGMRKDQDK